MIPMTTAQKLMIFLGAYLGRNEKGKTFSYTKKGPGRKHKQGR